ncbi:MAG: DUF4493 domain-containing protein [Cyclobacteriaceae bacterium]
MKKTIPLLILIITFFSCNRQDQETPEPTDFGYLSMNISVTITEEAASGRVEAVPTDNWNVTIFKADGTPEVVFDPYINAPAEIQLPTGEYYIEAHSNNFAEAAFENPYYFGRSDNFTIDKEEIKTIDIDAELANSKVAINYSSNVTSTFNDYTGAVTIVSTGTTLDYVQGETREGYFISEPLSVVVNLSYTKLDGTFITRQFSANIDAQPKTLYNINVDATLEDGEIVININVDEGFEVEEVELGDGNSSIPVDPFGFDLAWLNTYGGSEPDEVSQVIQLQDGGFLMIGKAGINNGDVLGNNGRDDVWLVRTDPSGTLIWSKNYGGSQIERGYAAVQLNNGSITVMAQTRSYDGDISNNPNINVNYSIWIFNIDTDGNLIWDIVIAGRNGSAQNIAKDFDGNLIYLGNIDNNEPNQSDSYIMKLDGQGNILSQTFIEEETFRGRNFQFTADEYFIGGYHTTQGAGSLTLLKINRLSEQIEVDQTYIPQAFSSQYSTGMLLQGQKIIMYGRSTIQNEFGFITEWDINGNVLQESYTSGTINDMVYIDNQYFATGFGIVGNFSRIIVTQLDLNLNEVNSRIIVGDFTDFGKSIIALNANEIVIGASTLSDSFEIPENNGNLDFTILKLNNQ